MELYLETETVICFFSILSLITGQGNQGNNSSSLSTATDTTAVSQVTADLDAEDVTVDSWKSPDALAVTDQTTQPNTADEIKAETSLSVTDVMEHLNNTPTEGTSNFSSNNNGSELADSATPLATTPENEKESEKSGGTVVFIVIGCTAVGVPALLIFCCCFKAVVVSKMTKTHPYPAIEPKTSVNKARVTYRPAGKKRLTLEDTAPTRVSPPPTSSTYLTFDRDRDKDRDRERLSDSSTASTDSVKNNPVAGGKLVQEGSGRDKKFHRVK